MQYFNRQINVKLSIFGVLLFLSLLSATILSSSISSADTEKQSDATVTVGSACTMFRESTIPHVVSVGPSSYREDVGTTRLKTVCNDTNGYAIYAIGYSNDTDGDTNMYGEEHGLTIPTGIETGDVSNWSMKLSKDLNAYNPENLTITPAFINYAPVPSTQTKVASFEGATDTTDGSIVETTYAIRVSSDQLADTYTGQVKYTMVHPADGTAPEGPEPVITYIQDIDKETCPTTPTTVVDSRDGNEYTIQRLADGNCWLLDNLRLDSASLKTTLTVDNTNMSPDITFTLPSSISDNFSSYGIPQINNSSKDTELSYGSGNGKGGVYYNYCAATAGTICDSSSDGRIEASYDICPKGWRMPTGGSDGEYIALRDAYQSGNLRESFRIVRAGYIYYSTVGRIDDAGQYWTSSPVPYETDQSGTSTYMQNMYMYDGRTYFDVGRLNRNYGISVRCIAKEPEPEPLTFQSFSPDSCPTTPTVVTDSRDGEEYTIQKLADGKCWMLDNLRLDLTDTNVKNNLTSDTTNASDSTLNYLKNGGGTTSDQYPINGVANWTRWEYSISDPLIDASNKNATGSGNYSAYSEGKYGVYYDFCAASAGSYCYGNGEEPGTSSGNAIEDICPKGWRMPTGGDTGEYKELYSSYGSVADFVNGFHLTLSGDVYPSYGYPVNTAFQGRFWASTRYDDEQMYMLFFGYGTNLGATDHITRSRGLTIRCIMIDSVPEPLYMQDVAEWKDSIAVNESIKATDKRDGRVYWVTRLETDSQIPDGRADCTGEGANRVCTQLWMTQNLDLELDSAKVYTHEDTDLGWSNNDSNVVWTPTNSSTSYLPYIGKDYYVSQSYDYTDEVLYTSGDTNNDTMYLNSTECVGDGHTADECTHYRAGNLYNWPAASALEATSGGEPVSMSHDNYVNAPNSVCPAGWKLPTGVSADNEYSDFDYLLYKSGIISSHGNNGISYLGDGFNSVRIQPFWFIRSGYLAFDDNDNATIGSKGANGYYWSSTQYASGQYSQEAAYSFEMMPYVSFPGYILNRTWGISVRCVARTDEELAPQPEPEPAPTDIQDITPANCPTTPTTVYDTRDGQVYTIQKLADGKCWMLDNLRLGRSTVKVLTPDDTNIRSNFTLPGSVSTGFDEFELPQINIDSKNDTTSYGDGENKIGVYYNFCAATAGTYCQPQNASAGTPTEDICPKGWRLPTGGENGEYQNLYAQYNTYADFKNALHASLSGYFKYAQTNHQGSYGSFWSSTPVGDDRMYSLDVRATSVPNDFTSYRTAGISIRCVAYEPTETYIQDITPDNCPTNPTTVYDTRDNSAYTIQKLADGNCWMLDNLRIGRSTMKVLTPNDTNIASDFILPGSISTGFDEFEIPQINIDSKNKVTSYGAGDNKIGVYYNYCAATAGTYCYAQGEAEGSTTEDICPKGWRMPTGGEDGEYQALYAQYNTYADFKNALHASLSGYFKYSSKNHQGSFGSYWSSTPVGDDRMYSLDVRADSVPDDFTSYRTAGISIRCIAKTSEVSYLQNLTAASCPTEPTTVVDSRDGEEYTIQKLADGRCWMLDNLRLDYDTLKMNLTTANTNMSPDVDFTIPQNTYVGFGSKNDTDTLYTEPQVYTLEKDETYSYGSGSAKVGVLYDYCAISAGTYCNESGQEQGNVEYDICPRGWRIPTGGTDGEYNNLFVSYNEDAEVFKDALRVGLSGYRINRFTYNSGGLFPSSTYHNPGNMKMLSLYAPSGNYNGVNADQPYGRGAGYPVRCIMKLPNESNPTPVPSTTVSRPTAPHYIQDVTISNCPTDAVKVYDIRDNEEYYIKKLKDGKCWMLDNLRLESDKLVNALSVDNTNMSPDISFTLPVSNSASSYSRLNPDVRTGSKDTPYTIGNSINGNAVTYGRMGVSYDYCAASAGTICTTSNAGNAEYDICPKGWRLPTGGAAGSNSEFEVLKSSSGGSLQALNDLRIFSGSIWSSTRNNNTSMHILYTNVTESNASSRYSFSYQSREYLVFMRCVLK